MMEGVAAPLMIRNLDTDQIMPKQYLKGVDKSGLDAGVLRDLRYDPDGALREDFVLNRPEYAGASILVGGENFGCGSSREHAVWGLLQFGIRAVVAPSFGEIFYNNAVNNLLLPATVSTADVQQFVEDISDPSRNRMAIDLERLRVESANHCAGFSLSSRHHDMFLKGQDLIDYSLGYVRDLRAFLGDYWLRHPGRRDIGRRVPGDEHR